MTRPLTLWTDTETGTVYVYLGPDEHDGYMIVREGRPKPGATVAGVRGGRMLDDPYNTKTLVPFVRDPEGKQPHRHDWVEESPETDGDPAISECSVCGVRIAQSWNNGSPTLSLWAVDGVWVSVPTDTDITWSRFFAPRISWSLAAMITLALIDNQGMTALECARSISAQIADQFDLAERP